MILFSTFLDFRSLIKAILSISLTIKRHKSIVKTECRHYFPNDDATVRCCLLTSNYGRCRLALENVLFTRWLSLPRTNFRNLKRSKKRRVLITFGWFLDTHSSTTNLHLSNKQHQGTDAIDRMLHSNITWINRSR